MGQKYALQAPRGDCKQKAYPRGQAALQHKPELPMVRVSAVARRIIVKYIEAIHSGCSQRVLC